jgi:lysozyme
VTPIEEPPRRSSIAESRTIQGATVAGGAGAAAATMGRESAEELDQVETNIQNGVGLTLGGADQDAPSSPDAAPEDEAEEETAIADASTDTDDVVDLGEDAEAETDPDAGDDIIAETDDGEVIVGDDSAAETETGEIVVAATTTQRPTKSEVHAVEAQIQLALLILILISVGFVIFARVDDWLTFRR